MSQEVLDHGGVAWHLCSRCDVDCGQCGQVLSGILFSLDVGTALANVFHQLCASCIGALTQYGQFAH